MTYRVIQTFRDKDTRELYRPGDVYPRPGTEPDAKRLEALSTAKNRRGEPMIARAEDELPEERAPRKGRKKAKEKATEKEE